MKLGNAHPFVYIQQAAAIYGFSKNSSVFGLEKHFAFKTILQPTDFERVIGLDKNLLSVK